MLKPVERWHAAGLVLALVASIATACAKKNESPTNPSCSATAGAANVSTFDAGGGSGSIPVAAAAGCSWTAVSNSAFITISQGASGTGNGTVAFTVAANTGADRTGTLAVAGSTITITQRGPTVVPTPATIAAPTAMSPSGGQIVNASRPTLVVSNATTTGSAGTVTYRFELADLPTFLDDPTRTFVRDGVPQGSGTTSFSFDRDLTPGIQFYWRARATNGTVTSAYSNVESFRTASQCNFTLSSTDVTVPQSGGSASVTVTADATCAWTATSNASFITIASGSSGTGTGTVTLNVAANTTGTTRGGTVTIANRTVTVTQSASNLAVGFRLLDPGRLGSAPTTSCHIRSATSVPTQCILESTSFPLGTTTIVSYTWQISYVYPTEKAATAVGTNPQFPFTEMCGLTGSNDSGLEIELRVTLTVTDSDGNSVTVRSNAGNQPLLTLRAYTCGI